MKLLTAALLTLKFTNNVSVKNRLSVNDLFVYESGVQNEQTILFLHGSGANSNMWLQHISELSKNFHCLAPDFPGHGRSNQVEWSNLDEVTELIAGLIKTKGHGKVHVVGLSLGGSVIYKLLEQYPELINKAFIDGASSVPVKGSFFIILGVGIVSPFLKTNLMMKMMASGLGVPEEEFPAFEEGIKMVSPKSFRRAMSQANQLKTELENFNFTIPILFVSGETESVTMHNSHHYLANQLPESKCAWYPEKGHAWMVADVKTHIQLTKYWFLNDTFPEQLVMEELTEGKK